MVSHRVVCALLNLYLASQGRQTYVRAEASKKTERLRSWLSTPLLWSRYCYVIREGSFSTTVMVWTDDKQNNRRWKVTEDSRFCVYIIWFGFFLQVLRASRT